MDEILGDLKASVEIAETAGVARENIWLDPGVGFARKQGRNILVMQGLREISRMGYPVLLGTSRKSLDWKRPGTSCRRAT